MKLPRAKEWRTVPRAGPSNRTIFPVNFEFVAEQGTQERVGGAIRRWQGLVGRGQGERWRRKRWPPTDPSLARSFVHSLTHSPPVSILSSLCAFNLPGGRQMFAPLPLDRATPVSLSLSPAVCSLSRPVPFLAASSPLAPFPGTTIAGLTSLA